MTRLKHLFFVLCLMVGIFIPLQTGADSDDPAIQACPDDYYGFILTAAPDGEREEPFQDLFRSYCQVNDILEINEELETLREQFRSAAWACEDTSTYKERYVKYQIELYFVRHVQEVNADMLTELEIKAGEEAWEKGLTLALLWNEMRTLFVDEEGTISGPDFDEYFEVLSREYDEKVVQYYRCDEGPWAELTSTWTSFVDTINNIDFEIDPPEERSFQEIVTPDTNEDKFSLNTGEIGQKLINAFKFKENAEARRNAEVEEPYTPSEAAANSGSFNAALDALSTSSTSYDVQTAANERMARYELLYGEGGTVAASDMQGVIEELNRVIEETNTKDFPNITAGSAKIYDKQCN